MPLLGAEPFGYIRNRILRNLDAQLLRALLAQLEPVRLHLKTIVHQVGRRIEHVYFVESGTVSMIAAMVDGGHAEVGLVGREGVVGLPVVLGSAVANLDALVQVDATARRIPVEAFRRHLDTMPPLQEALLRYTNLFHAQVAQTAACNARHTIDKRLARWILMTADRVEDDQFPMTQEFMARMLAVQRPGVTLALQRLQSAGLIQPHRGWLRIVDRPALEAASCECYGVVHDMFEAETDHKN